MIIPTNDTKTRRQLLGILHVFGIVVVPLALAAQETGTPAFEVASNQLDIYLGAFNTAVLIMSSLTMALAVWASSLGKKNLIILFLILVLSTVNGFLILVALAALLSI